MKSLTRELNFQHTILFVIAASILFYFTYRSFYDYVRDNESKAVAQHLVDYKDWYEGGSTLRLNQRFTATPGMEQKSYLIVTRDRDGKMTFHSREDVKLDGKGRLLPPEEGKWIWQEVPLEDGNAMIVAKDISEALKLLIQLRNTFVIIMLISAALLFGGGAYITHSALAPIRHMTQTAKRIIKTGDLKTRVPLRNKKKEDDATPTDMPPEIASKDEIDNLAVLFNVMLERNSRLISSMRETLDNVAHDLRTPITRLRGALETGLSHDQDPVVMSNSLGEGMEETDHILKILNMFMDVSSAETGAMKFKKETFKANLIAERVLDLYQYVAEESEIALEVTQIDSFNIFADQTRLEQVVANLVDNAIKYTQKGGRVTLSLIKSAGEMVISVSDTGIGIAPKDYNEIWKRLYRCDASRSKRGLGLGLCMVKAVVDAHGGKVELESELGQGSTFRIRIPLQAE